MKISKIDARRFLINYHNLTDEMSLSGADGILEYIKKAGCIQYDPLDIIGRNTDLVLQSRVRDYKPEMLESLLYKDRLLIDGWDKMMSIYCVDDWPFFHFVRERNGIETISVLKHRNSSDALQYTDVVLDTIKSNGPTLPKHIKLGSAGTGNWGHRNLSGATMDYLWAIGKIGVHKKIGVNKVYDFIENLLPENILSQPNPFKTQHDFMKWYVYRRLGSLGILWNRNGGGWLATLMGNKEQRLRFFDEYESEGLIQKVEIEGIPEVFYIRSKDAYLFDNDPKTDARESIRFIAPLDNMMWDRDMLAKIFDFKYSWEVYIPVAKRKYGYYVIPVLYGNRFIARFEPEKSKTHVKIKNWWWEKDVSDPGDLVEPVIKEMERLALCFHKNEGVHESVRETIMNQKAGC